MANNILNQQELNNLIDVLTYLRSALYEKCTIFKQKWSITEQEHQGLITTETTISSLVSKFDFFFSTKIRSEYKFRKQG